MKILMLQGNLEIILHNLPIFLKSDFKKWVLLEKLVWISELTIKGKPLNSGLVTIKSFKQTFK